MPPRPAHAAAFASLSGYIPLALNLRSLYSINLWEYFLDPQAMLAHELEKARAVQAIGSDAIPCVVARFDPVVVPSLFGGKVECVGGRPMIAPFLDGPRDIARLPEPAPDTAVAGRAAEALRYFLANTPEDIAVVTPPELDPFDAALLMYGSGLFTLMHDEPEAVTFLLDRVTDAFIRVQLLFKEILGEPPREKVNYLGIALPGIRVAADALVNLSPTDIRRFCYPVFAKLAAAFGGVLVHYCPSPTLRYYHVLKPVLECPHVLGVCTSGGVDYFEDERNPMRLHEGKTLIGECDLRLTDDTRPIPTASTNVNTIPPRPAAGLDEWLGSPFMRLSFDGRRGLILRAAVSTVEEGRQLYGLWRRKVEAAAQAAGAYA